MDKLLLEHERQSALWQKIEQYLKTRIDLLRQKNDNDHDERKTARLRGSIVELKHLLSQGTAEPLPAPENEFKD